MLTLGSSLIDIPVMSLQTGYRLAKTAQAVIDPEDLKIVAYKVEGSMLSEKPSLLSVQDIREIGSIGMIIDSNDEFIGIDDVVSIKKIYELHFPLLNMQVMTKSGSKIGKVDDYVIESTNFYIKQISIKPSLIKSINNTGRLIDRSQIIEINNKNIVIKDANQVEPVAQAVRRDFVNPFATSPQSEAISSSSSDFTISS